MSFSWGRVISLINQSTVMVYQREFSAGKALCPAMLLYQWESIPTHTPEGLGGRRPSTPNVSSETVVEH